MAETDVADGFAYMAAYARMAKQALDNPNASKTMGIPTAHVASAGEAYAALAKKMDALRRLAESWVSVEYGSGFARELRGVLDV